MSLKAMVWAFESSKSTGAARLVLLALADTADDAGLTWPSMETIAAKANVSVSTARRHVRELETLGELVVEIGGGRAANRYRLAMPDLTPVKMTEHPGQNDRAPRSAVTEEQRTKELKNLRTKNVSREDHVKGSRTLQVDAWRRSEADKTWQAEHDIPAAFSYAQTELWKGWLTGPTPAAKRTVDFNRSWRNWVLRAWTDLTEYRRNDWRNTETAS